MWQPDFIFCRKEPSFETLNVDVSNYWNKERFKNPTQEDKSIQQTLSGHSLSQQTPQHKTKKICLLILKRAGCWATPTQAQPQPTALLAFRRASHDTSEEHKDTDSINSIALFHILNKSLLFLQVRDQYYLLKNRKEENLQFDIAISIFWGKTLAGCAAVKQRIF